MGGGPGMFLPNVSATRHHVFPKSKLQIYLTNISKAVEADRRINEQTEFNVTDSGNAVAIMQQVKKVYRIYSTNPNNYYWNTGNYFIGIASDKRTDDPKSNIEPKKPQSINANKWTTAIAWGSSLKKINGQIGQFNFNTSAISESLQLFNQLNFLGTTSAIQDQDWKAVPHDSWGEDYKIYSLVG